ncbi:hypothetical protein Scep_004394 [Stephania cephalantha]|uniref:Transposase MuDR plant domain-containing protein n=1 Tax=Stephania cephalantha TaxID=152367 RepID=A0AAP0KTA9_9MAGN
MDRLTSLEGNVKETKVVVQQTYANLRAEHKADCSTVKDEVVKLVEQSMERWQDKFISNLSLNYRQIETQLSGVERHISNHGSDIKHEVAQVNMHFGQWNALPSSSTKDPMSMEDGATNGENKKIGLDNSCGDAIIPLDDEDEARIEDNVGSGTINIGMEYDDQCIGFDNDFNMDMYSCEYIGLTDKNQEKNIDNDNILEVQVGDKERGSVRPSTMSFESLTSDAFTKDQLFINKKKLRHSLGIFAMKNNFEYKVIRSTKELFVARCVQKEPRPDVESK